MIEHIVVARDLFLDHMTAASLGRLLDGRPDAGFGH
jgi:hypothetical protein